MKTAEFMHVFFGQVGGPQQTGFSSVNALNLS